MEVLKVLAKKGELVQLCEQVTNSGANYDIVGPGSFSDTD